ncbi:MAG: glycosyltransferase [Deltaproteobacteria bacterium]|nr:glycosyltransferase [Deltaproteobacteria bacterium]
MPKEDQPLVSVIIPVYNGTNYLREAIDSVLAQTYTHCEILVVDDGSTDGTWEIIQSYGTRIRGIHKENGGVASALNCGIREAEGKYIAWLSHDDFFLPEKLAHQVKFLNEFKEFKACYTNYYITDPRMKIRSEVVPPWYPRAKAIRALFGDMYISGSTVLIERNCFTEIGLFSESLRYTQDAEMWLRVIRRYDIGHLPESLVKQRSHPGQGSVNFRTGQRKETRTLYERFFCEWGIGGIFPERAQLADESRTQAKAHIWFGDTMAVHRGYYDLADEHYRISKSLWPDWRNPARTRLLFGSRVLLFPRRLFHYFLFRLFGRPFPVLDIA